MQDFDGRVAVITGGASGIGYATARLLAGEGMKLVLADVEPEALDKAVANLASDGARVIGVETDVADLAQVEALADATWAQFGGAHVLFNNAGVAVFGPVHEMTHADWEWVINVDLWGVVHGVETFLPRMIDQGEGGHIVNTASFAGLVANQGLSVYCVAKYGVVALSECLARDVRDFDIGSSVLCPMVVATNINQSARNRPAALGGPERDLDVSAEQEKKMRGRVLPVEGVAEKVVRAIRENQLYIVTHEESREFIRRRFDRIDAAFEQ